jgi:glycosyltransferase involved in cell wall biosynthesis
MARVPSVLFLNQHYYPDLASTAQHLTDLAEHLAGNGFEVHVLCSQGHYLSGTQDAPREEVHNGVHIHRLPATSFGRETMAGRLADYASFFLQALYRVLTGPRFDCVVSLTTPPMVHLVAWAARQLRGQRYGIWSMDLHPDAEEAVGLLHPGGMVARALHALNNRGYRGADFVVDLGRAMRRRLREKGVAVHRLHTLPVWNKKDEVFPVDPEDNPLMEEVGLRDKFVVMYSGNAGLAHRFDEVLGAMRRLRNHPDIFFLFVGEGPRKEEICSFIRQEDIDNARYLPYFPREQIKYSLSLADVHLLTLRPDMDGIAVPGKLYGILAAGRPALMVGPKSSELARIIETHDVGALVDPTATSDPTDHLVHHLRTLYEDPDYRRAQGQRARTTFVEHFEQRVVCEQWTSLLEEHV